MIPDQGLPLFLDQDLHDALGLSEEPYGMFYADAVPPDALLPEACMPIAAQLAQNGQVDMKAVRGHFSCVLNKLRAARRKRTAAAFAADRFGCVGGSFFLGFHRPQIDFIAHYVSTGFPGTPVRGERYLDSPETTRRFFAASMPPPAPARFCVFKPLSRFAQDETPLLIVFFGRAEVLNGLCTLTAFVSGDFHAVRTPFAAGCASLAAWPLRFLAEGQPLAVLGGADPSCRPYLQVDEMTFSVPLSLYRAYQERWRESFLTTPTWSGVRKKIERSNRVWESSRK